MGLKSSLPDLPVYINNWFISAAGQKAEAIAEAAQVGLQLAAKVPSGQDGEEDGEELLLCPTRDGQAGDPRRLS